MAGREGVQHADRDAGWRLGRRDSVLNLDPKTQTHQCAHSDVRRLGLGLDLFFDTNSIRGSNSVDSDCDFESVPPDQLCPSDRDLKVHATECES